MPRKTIEGDGHVHIYPEFDLARVIEDALVHAAARDGLFWLLVVDREGEHGFSALQDSAQARGLLLETREASSFRIGGEESACVALAGRQVVSSSGTEVLGVGLDPDAEISASPDGHWSTRELVERFIDVGGAAVLPWGMGKWLGRRGEAVAELWQDTELRAHPRFLLGDVGHRCAPWPRPSIFGDGARVLAGSDALPVRGAEARIGRYGFRMEVDYEPDTPARAWLAALDRGQPIESWGRREDLVSTIREQLAYRRVARRKLEAA